jgi:hypothetical protein
MNRTRFGVPLIDADRDGSLRHRSPGRAGAWPDILIGPESVRD